MNKTKRCECCKVEFLLRDIKGDLCENCYNFIEERQNLKIADLEAKLAESNEQLEMAWDDFHRMQNEKIKVQHQLAEQPKQIVDKIKDFVHNNYIYVEETDLRVIKYDLLYKFLDNLLKEMKD